MDLGQRTRFMSWQQTVIVCFTVWMLIKSKQYQELLRYRYSGCGNKMTKSVSTMSWQKHEAGFVSQKNVLLLMLETHIDRWGGLDTVSLIYLSHTPVSVRSHFSEPLI